MTAQSKREAAHVALLTQTASTIKNLLNSCPLPDLDRTILAAQLEDIENHLKSLEK